MYSSHHKQKEKRRRIVKLEEYLKRNRQVLMSDLEKFAQEELEISMKTFRGYLKDFHTLDLIRIVRNTPFKSEAIIVWTGK